MSRITNRFLWILFIVCVGCNEHPTDIIDDFEESRPDQIKAFYAYPSTIRMLGQIMESTNINALEEVEKARVFIHWKDEESEGIDAFQNLLTEVEESSFEDLIRLNSKESSIRVFLSEENGETPVYLILSFGSDVDYLIEIEGEISMQTLKDLGTMDIDNAMDILDLGKPKAKEEQEESEDQYQED